MSTQITYYFVYGVCYDFDELPYDEDEDEFYEQFKHLMASASVEPNKDIGTIKIIFDAMNGEYVVIGYILGKSRLNGEEFIPNDVVEGDLSDDKRLEIHQKLQNEFGVDKKAKYMVVCHVT